MKKIILKGAVVPGVGGGKNYLELQWIKQQIEEKLGFKPYSGTLNILLSEESVKERLELHHDREDMIRPQVGSFPGILIRAQIGPYDCAIVHPENHNYPSDIVEVIAPVNLRKELNLVDGSEVTIEIL